MVILKEKSEMSRLIDELDISLISAKVSRKLEWTAAREREAVEGYKNFLKNLTPGMSPPTEDVDEIWHYHILDTERYMNDCQTIFGTYIHHRPVYNSPCQSSCRASGPPPPPPPPRCAPHTT